MTRPAPHTAKTDARTGDGSTTGPAGSSELGFLAFLREASAEQGRGNDELVRAMVPLMRQVLDHHDEGRVAPLSGVQAVFAAEGHLWFHDADATAPRIDTKAVRAMEDGGAGVQVVDRTAETLDLTGDRAQREARSRLIGEPGAPLEWPVYLPGYLAWEQELDHHDALTDIFSLGMMLASLAVGADFTEPDELAHFVAHRRALTTLNAGLHPVIAKAIVRTTELDRHKRAQDLLGLIERLERYREVDDQADADLDFTLLEGFRQADLSSRRRIIQRHLQSRLFDVSRRNRLIYFRPTLQTLDLTEASVPAQLNVERIKPEELFLWEGPGGETLSQGKPFRLDRYLRFEEAPWLRGVLDQVRNQARRDRAEFGMSQLRLVIAFLNWHDLREDPDTRVRSPLLLLPVTLEKKRGVRDSYVLKPLSDEAEVNPVLRHTLKERYELDLPEHVDLRATDLPTFHRVLAASIARSEPGVSLHYVTRPQIRLIHRKARRKLEAWRRKAQTSGRGVRRYGDVSYSYGKRNFSPLGLQLFVHRVKPERLDLAEHLKSARLVAGQEAAGAQGGPPETSAAPDADEAGDQRGAGARVGSGGPKVSETEREVYQLTEAARGPYDWAVDLTHLTLGNFNYRKMSLVRDYDRMLAAPAAGNTASGEGGDRAPSPTREGGTADAEAPAHPAFDLLFSLDARPVDIAPPTAVDPFAPHLVLPADPTQTAAVLRSRSGQGFIVQGPPGTGKSQTITNLIADFAARGKHVLFVCEKRAALDVVYHRLAQHDLDELSVLIHDSQGDKKAFIQDLKSTYEGWLSHNDEGSDAEAALTAARAAVAEPLAALERFTASMCAPAEGATLPVAAVLRERLRCPTLPAPLRDEAASQQAVAGEALPSHATWHSHRGDVHALGRALDAVGEAPVLAELGVRHVSQAVLEAANPRVALRTGVAEVRALLAQAEAARAWVGPDATAADLSDALALARELAPLAEGGNLALLDANSAAAHALRDLELREASAERELAQAVEAAKGWRQRLPRADLSAAVALAQRFERLFVLFRWFMPAWWRLRGVLRARYDFASHAVPPTWGAALGQLQLTYEREDRMAAVRDEARDRFGVDLGADAAARSVRAWASDIAALRSRDGRSPLQRRLLAQWAQGDGRDLRGLLDAGEAIAALSAAADAVLHGGGALDLERLAAAVDEAERGADLLGEVRTPLAAVQQSPVYDAVCRVPLAPAEWDAAVCEGTLGATFRKNRPLARFDARALAALTAQVHDNHAAWLRANADAVRARVRRNFLDRVHLCAQPASQLDGAGKALKKAYNAGRRELEREFKKVMRHKSIRSLTDGATGTVVYDLKPIWLMSPLSISDTLPLDEQRFDVVIFDEASQIPLEEAVPAVMRAPQMIVVGDEMQLPPTSFFSSGGSRDDEDDESVAATYDLQADSFLTHAAQRLPSTMLGWHYRSRSEALIRFSNHAFYGGDLLTVPDRSLPATRPPIEVSSAAEGRANAAHVRDRAVSFHHMQRSAYVQRRNPGEARYIAELVRGLLDSDEPQRPTLGVVAFSEAQQGEIEKALRELGEEDRDFGRRLEAEIEREEDGQLCGLFVKNLENVQGDERDIIVLSVCYGPNRQGAMRMNFGPINKGGGEKRLNVVFSRAKRHMAVVSSIRYSAITNEYNDGALCFRRYLQYAEAMSVGDQGLADTLMHALAGGQERRRRSAETAEATPVIDGLADALERAGLAVSRQVGASGFQVDLAVREPSAPGWQVAVLVDSARHYAKPDAFDRFHARPGVLSAFGWRVQWVLTKDWLADREACVQRVRGAVAAVAAEHLAATQAQRQAQAGRDATGASETGAPEMGVPETGAPETGAPDTGAPETGAPETGATPDEREADAAQGGAPASDGEAAAVASPPPEETP